MPLLPSRSFTHRPRVPLALVPTVENPIGVNVNLLLPPERLALALSKMEECMVLSRSTVLTPFFVITAIQRLPSDAAQLTPSELGQTALLSRLLMAAERAVCSRATISLADEDSRLPRIRFAKLGVAMIEMMVRTASVTMSSTRVNPRMADGPAIVGLRCSMDPPEFCDRTLTDPNGVRHPCTTDGRLPEAGGTSRALARPPFTQNPQRGDPRMRMCLRGPTPRCRTIDTPYTR